MRASINELTKVMETEEIAIYEGVMSEMHGEYSDADAR